MGWKLAGRAISPSATRSTAAAAMIPAGRLTVHSITGSLSGEMTDGITVLLDDAHLVEPIAVIDSTPGVVHSRRTHFRLIENIGQGGMDVVWKAEDTVLGRTVAIYATPCNSWTPVGATDIESKRGFKNAFRYGVQSVIRVRSRPLTSMPETSTVMNRSPVPTTSQPWLGARWWASPANTSRGSES